MIKVVKNDDGSNTMTIDLYGNAEEIAQEYVSLTLKIHERYPAILDRAQWYLEDILELRRRIREDD